MGGPSLHRDAGERADAASKFAHLRISNQTLKHASEMGVKSVRIATHCTEADVSRQHIEAARNLGMDVWGFLMMSPIAPPEALVRQAKLMEDHGAHCVYLTD